MEFLVLGPLEVRGPLGVAKLGSARQRALLARLLLAGGRVVSVDALVDAVWGDQPPATTAALQMSVSRLRRALTAVEPGADRLATLPAGYQLRVEPAELDLTEFRARVERGRAAHRDGHIEQAARELRAALELWRGPALAELPQPHFQPVAAALAEERLAALEERAAADLALGRAAELVPELRALIADHPLREPLYPLLMGALHRTHRVAEALETYQQARRVLRAELGVEPGPELRAAQQRLLTDREPPEPPRAPAAAAAPVPRQLPANPAHFTGRAAGLAALDRLLPSRQPAGAVAPTVAVVTGTAGVGKTALAVHWAHQVSAEFPDGQLYVDFHGFDPIHPPARPEDALTRLLRALGVPPEQLPRELAEQSALLRSTLAERRVLVLLDNVAHADQARPLFPAAPGCLTVVTSRHQLTGLVARDGARPVALDVLTEDESLALLSRLLRPHAPADPAADDQDDQDDPVAADPAAARELAELCARLPLALRIAAGNLVVRGGVRLADAVAELRAGDRLDQLAVPDDPSAAVGAAFDVSFRALAEPERVLFQAMGVLPGPDLTVPAVAALLAEPEPAARDLLLRLGAAGLVEQRRPARYQVHDLLRLYAERSLDDPGVARVQLDRLLAWYLDRVRRAAERIYPTVLTLPHEESAPGPAFPDEAAAMAWLEDELPNLVAAIGHSARSDLPASWLLADGLRGFFWLRKHLAEWVAVVSAALDAARRRGDEQVQAAMHTSLATYRLSTSELTAATEHLAAALRHARAAGWRQGEASALGNLGNVHRDLGNLDAAVEHYAAALELHRALGQRDMVTTSLTNLGIVYRDLGRLAEAVAHCEQALAAHEAARASYAVAVDRYLLGMLRLDLGELPAAERELRLALELHRGLGSRQNEAYCRNGLARHAAAVGDHDRAVRLAAQALELAVEIGDRPNEVDAHTLTGRVRLRQGRPADAVAEHRAALRLAQVSGHQQGSVEALCGLALALSRLGEHAEAEEHAERALGLSERSGHRVLAGQALATRAEVRLVRGDRERAVADAEAALALHRRTGHRLGEPLALAVLARAATVAGDVRVARGHWQEVSDLLTGIGAGALRTAAALPGLPVDLRAS